MRKLGVSTLHSNLGITIEQNLDIIKEAGFDCVFSSYKEDGSIDNAKAIKYAKSIGLEYETLHGPFSREGRQYSLNAVWTKGEEGQEYISFLKRGIDVCSDNEVKTFILHNCVSTFPPPVSDIGLERFALLYDYAKEKGVRLAIENLESTEHLAALMGLATEFHGFCWDCGHNLCYTPTVDLPRLYGKRMICTHIHDNLGITRPGDIHYRDDLHLLPFDGSLSWEWFAKKIKQCGYSGPLTLELSLKPQYEELGAENYYAEAYARASKLREMCL